MNLMAFAGGCAYSWSSPMGDVLKSTDPNINPLERPITTTEESWITSIISLSATLSACLSLIISEKIGRKNTLLMFSIPMLISHVMCVLTTTPLGVLIARFLLGLGVGAVFCAIPVYIAEIAENHNRGLLGCSMGVMVSTGILFCYVVGPFIHYITLSYILMVPPILFFFMFAAIAPETPYYYVSKGKYLEAEKALAMIRDLPSGLILKELEAIKDTVESSRNNNVSLMKSLQSISFKRGLTITLLTMFFQQGVGITIILSYMQSIFAAAGTNFSPELSVIVVSVVQTSFVLVSTSLVDKLGRKVLFVIAGFGTGVTSAVIGTFFYLKSSDYDLSSYFWVPIAALILYLASYNLALGPLPWVLSGELFSSQTKTVGSTLTAMTCLFLAFLTALVFPGLINLIGMHGAFWFFSLNGFLCMLFILLRLPETKGKSFQEILEVLGKS